jgi:ABC-type sugar transport system permease subunit
VIGRALRGGFNDGASRWQKFKFITSPSMQTLYFTSSILSIWTLGDFNSVYLLTAAGPRTLPTCWPPASAICVSIRSTDGGDRSGCLWCCHWSTS